MLKSRFFLAFTTLAILGLCGSPDSLAQRQLVLLRGDQVLHRFRVGDKLRTKLHTDGQEHWGFLVEIDEFYFITSQDTIPIKQIKKILKPGNPPVKTVGRTLMIAGVGYLVIDQINYVLVRGNSPPRVDKKVWNPAAILTGMGLPLFLKSRDWRKVGGNARLISVDNSSRFYKVED